MEVLCENKQNPPQPNASFTTTAATLSTYYASDKLQHVYHVYHVHQIANVPCMIESSLCLQISKSHLDCIRQIPRHGAGVRFSLE